MKNSPYIKNWVGKTVMALCHSLCPALAEEPAPLFIPGEYCLKHAAEAWEIAGHFRLRRDVFCLEQGIFAGDDRDDADRTALPIVALTCLLGAPDQVIGTVRIHQTAPGHWQGSRLAVQRGFRRLGGLGAGLIAMAVGTARAYGAERFIAHVQPQNVQLFQRLHWTDLAEIDLHGRPHHLMQADLTFYPPYRLPQTRWVSPHTGRRAA
jgi:putative N-acetyltransferase (TIGR04045 family)